VKGKAIRPIDEMPQTAVLVIGWRFAVIDLVHVVMSFIRNSGEPAVWWDTVCFTH
jgi:hypothetical protein